MASGKKKCPDREFRRYFQILLALFFLSSPGFSNSQVPISSPPADSFITRSEIGFATREKLNEHYRKHRKEFGRISKEEYLRRAQELRDRPVGGDILEAVRKDGVATRFDRKTGAFLAFNRDGTIRTFFRPNAGEKYFWNQTRRHGTLKSPDVRCAEPSACVQNLFKGIFFIFPKCSTVDEKYSPEIFRQNSSERLKSSFSLSSSLLLII